MTRARRVARAIPIAAIVLVLIISSIAMGTTIDDFESGDLTAWDVTEAGYSVQSTIVQEGSFAVQFDASGPSEGTYELSNTTLAGTPGNITYWYRADAFNSFNPRMLWAYDTAVRLIFVQLDSDGSVLNNNVDTGITLTADTWYEVNYHNIDYGSNQYDLAIYDTNGDLVGEANNIGFDNAGSAIDEVSFLGATDGNNGEDFFVDDVRFNELPTAEQPTPEFPVNGTVTESDGDPIQTANVSALNSTGSLINATQTDASGEYTLYLPNATYDFEVGATGYQNRTREITVNGAPVENEDFVLLAVSGPYVTAASPRAGVFRSDRSVTLNATVDSPNGDDVTVDFFWKNDSTGNFHPVGSQTVTAGSTATASVESNTGLNEWYVNLSAGGQSTQSATFQYYTPGNITVYNGTDFSVLNTTQVTAIVEGQTTDYREIHTTSDGTLSLDGVPDDQFVVELGASGFVNQTVVLNDPTLDYIAVLYQDPNQTAAGEPTTYNQSFTLDDQSGEFPPTESWLQVRAYVDGSWQTIASKKFGAANLATVTLQDGENYRLRVTDTSETGSASTLSTVDVGQFVADDTLGTQTLTIYEDDVDDEDAGRFVSSSGTYSWDANLDTDAQEITLEFDALAGATVSNFSYTITRRGDGFEIRNETLGSVESVDVAAGLNDTQVNQTWIVEWNADVNGEAATGRKVVTGDTGFDLTDLPDWVKQTLSALIILLTAFTFTRFNASIGAVITATMAGFLWWLGLMPGMATGGTIAFALGIAVIYKAATDRGGG